MRWNRVTVITILTSFSRWLQLKKLDRLHEYSYLGIAKLAPKGTTLSIVNALHMKNRKKKSSVHVTPFVSTRRYHEDFNSALATIKIKTIFSCKQHACNNSLQMKIKITFYKEHATLQTKEKECSNKNIFLGSPMVELDFNSKISLPAYYHYLGQDDLGV